MSQIVDNSMIDPWLPYIMHIGFGEIEFNFPLDMEFDMFQFARILDNCEIRIMGCVQVVTGKFRDKDIASAVFARYNLRVTSGL